MTHLATFKSLHETDTFVIPNAVDVGEARLFQAMGASAVATTSAGFAATLGRMDQAVTRDEVVAHVEAIADAVDLPVSVDAEDGYASDPEGVARTIQLLANAGAVGVSIEDYHPASALLYDADIAVERVAAAVAACRDAGVVLTARCDGLLYGVTDEAETVARLQRYRDLGADCLYAPGPTDIDVIARIVEEADAPVNVLAFPGGPTVAELAAVGVRRVSVGSWFSRATTALVASLFEDVHNGGCLPADLVQPEVALLERAWG